MSVTCHLSDLGNTLIVRFVKWLIHGGINYEANKGVAGDSDNEICRSI